MKLTLRPKGRPTAIAWLALVLGLLFANNSWADCGVFYTNTQPWFAPNQTINASIYSYKAGTPAGTRLTGWSPEFFQNGVMSGVPANCDSAGYIYNSVRSDFSSPQVIVDGQPRIAFPVLTATNGDVIVGVVIDMQLKQQDFSPPTGWVPLEKLFRALRRIPRHSQPNPNFTLSFRYTLVVVREIPASGQLQIYPDQGIYDMNLCSQDNSCLYRNTRDHYGGGRILSVISNGSVQVTPTTCSFSTGDLPDVSLGTFTSTTFNGQGTWKSVGIKTNGTCDVKSITMGFTNAPGYTSPPGNTNTFGAKTSGVNDSAVGVELDYFDGTNATPINPGNTHQWTQVPAINQDFGIRARLIKVGAQIPVLGSGKSQIVALISYQ